MNKFFLKFLSGYFVLASQTSMGTVFDWTTGNTQVNQGSHSYSLTVGGISATVEAYTAEWNDSNQSYTIFGRFPATGGQGNNAIFNRLPGGLNFRAESFGGVTLSGIERCNLGGCGFDNAPYLNDNPSVSGDGTQISKFNFALVMFDQPVDLVSFTQSNISNFDHDFWIATNQTAPDLNTDFMNAVGAWDVTNTNPAQGNFFFNDFGNSHKNFQYMAIGAPIQLGVGTPSIFDNPDSQFRDSFQINSFDVGIIPIPGAIWLFGSGLFGLIGVGKLKSLKSA